MKKPLDIGNLLAILFVAAGALPIVWWLATRLLPRLRAEHAIQAALVLIVLYFAWWFRKRMEKR